ncbi:MAG: HAMP domain-containing sensor histidine kinase [Propionibacteriales bacterium]|nr:HAMP domain-containing sensor histidine kinase [Propionibacteriales bacterium]
MSEQDRTDAPDGRPGVMDAARRRIHPFTARASLALRVALLTTGAVAAVLAVASATVYITVRAELEDSLDASLIKRADAAVAAGYSPSTMSTADTDLLAVFGIRFISVEGGRIFTRQTQTNVPFDEREIQVSLGEEKTSQRTARIAGVPYRIVAVQAGPGQALVLAQSMESTQRSLERLKVILLLTSAVGILVAGVAGWVVATNGLRPVRRLTAATERVARTAQLEPIEVTGSEHDELARLTSSFNQMMLALDASQQRQRQLVADAGHELRTPLTSLRTNIELLGQATERSDRDLSIEQRREIMDDVRAQLGELTTLVGDLVELARDEPLHRAPEPLDLVDVVEQAVERVRPRAGGLVLDVRLEPWDVIGEAHVLERAVTNLLDNAVKWSPEGGTVTVRLRDGVLTVRDEGPGIAAEDLPHVFERFFRSTEARTMPGSGLGLSIVHQAAVRHGGSVRAESPPSGGTVVTFELPAATDTPPA